NPSSWRAGRSVSIATTRFRYCCCPGGPPTGDVSYTPDTATTDGNESTASFRWRRRSPRFDPSPSSTRLEFAELTPPNPVVARESMPLWYGFARQKVGGRSLAFPTHAHACGVEQLRHRRPQLAHGDRHREHALVGQHELGEARREPLEQREPLGGHDALDHL